MKRIFAIVATVAFALISVNPATALPNSTGVTAKTPVNKVFVSVKGISVSNLNCGGGSGVTTAYLTNTTSKVQYLEVSVDFVNSQKVVVADSYTLVKASPKSKRLAKIDFPYFAFSYNTCNLFVDKMQPSGNN